MIFHQDKSVWIRARRRVLHDIFNQFSCALHLKMWGIFKKVKCRLCENLKYYKHRNMEAPDSVESVKHIQCYYPALQLPHIAIHHGIWKALILCSSKLNNENESRWQLCLDSSMECYAVSKSTPWLIYICGCSFRMLFPFSIWCHISCWSNLISISGSLNEWSCFYYYS